MGSCAEGEGVREAGLVEARVVGTGLAGVEGEVADVEVGVKIRVKNCRAWTKESCGRVSL